MAIEEKNLVKYRLAPTLDVKKIAKERGISPEEYIANQPIYLVGNNGDQRKRYGKNGEIYLQDVDIYLPDGTRIQIHPIRSDIIGFDKVELYVEPYNRTETTLIAYADKNGLDYEKMQTNQEYLQALGQVLSLRRLAEKLEKAEKNGLKGRVCYIGSVDSKEGKYTELAPYAGEEKEISAINKIKEAIEESKRMEQLKAERERDNARYLELIGFINFRRSSLPHDALGIINGKLEDIARYIEKQIAGQEKTH